MDFDKLRRKAQDIYTARGGAEAAKGDAREVEEILKGHGTMMDKAKRAAQALKQPGAAGDPDKTGDPDQTADPTGPSRAEPQTQAPAPRDTP